MFGWLEKLENRLLDNTAKSLTERLGDVTSVGENVADIKAQQASQATEIGQAVRSLADSQVKVAKLNLATRMLTARMMALSAGLLSASYLWVQHFKVKRQLELTEAALVQERADHMSTKRDALTHKTAFMYSTYMITRYNELLMKFRSLSRHQNYDQELIIRRWEENLKNDRNAISLYAAWLELDEFESGVTSSHPELEVIDPHFSARFNQHAKQIWQQKAAWEQRKTASFINGVSEPVQPAVSADSETNPPQQAEQAANNAGLLAPLWRVIGWGQAAQPLQVDEVTADKDATTTQETETSSQDSSAVNDAIAAARR